MCGISLNTTNTGCLLQLTWWWRSGEQAESLVLHVSRKNWNLLTILCLFFWMCFSSSERPAPKLPAGGSSRRAQPVDVTGWCRCETEDGGLWPGCWDPSDYQPDVHLRCGALWRLHSSELEGGRAAEEPELQRILPDLPPGCKELP